MDKIISKNTDLKIKNSFDKLGKNDEFEVMFKNYTQDKRLSLKEFIRVIKVLNNFCKDNNLDIKNNNSLDLSYSYDINSFDIYRLSINNQELIQNLLAKYGNRRNHIIFAAIVKEKLTTNNKNIELIKKVRNNKLTFDINDYDLRFRVSLEQNVSKNEASDLLELSSDERFNIKIRLKQRATFTVYEDKNFKIVVDCTISKTSQNLKSVNDVNENYEIELEIIRKKNKIKYSVVRDELINKINYILKNLNETDEVITNKLKIDLLNKYYELVTDKKKINSLYRMNAESLEIQHVVDKIVKNYTVSDKADGEGIHSIINNGKLYYIDSNCNVTDSGIKNSKLSKFNDTILDGELIYIDKYKKRVFLVFDILFYNGKDIRKNDLNTRFQYLDDVINSVFINMNEIKIKNSYSTIDDSLKDHEDKIEKYLINFKNELENSKDTNLVFRKYFIFTYGFSENEIFKYSKLLWEKYSSELCPYEIDGIMYTPINQHYTKKMEDVTFKIYKWKPPELNSIDFWVEFEKNKETGKIETVFDNTENEEFKNKPYNIAYLHVGKKVGKYETPVL